MVKKKFLQDELFTNDTLNTIVDKTSKDPMTGFKTRIVVKSKDPVSGQISVKSYKNKTAMFGRMQLLEDFFDVTPNYDKHLFLNDNILGSTSGVIYTFPTGLSDDIRPKSNSEIFKRRRVKWFCVGNGAENKTNPYTSWPAHDTDTKLFNMIPFRLRRVDDDLQPSEAVNYRGKVQMNINGQEYYAYYFKRIEIPENTGVSLTIDGADHTPRWANSVPDLNAPMEPPNDYANGRNLQMSLKFNLSLGNGELQEWFTVTDNTLANARFNEIGLVSGLECDKTLGINRIITSSSPAEQVANSEVWDAELASHLTISSQAVSSPGFQIEFVYSVFA